MENRLIRIFCGLLLIALIFCAPLLETLIISELMYQKNNNLSLYFRAISIALILLTAVIVGVQKLRNYWKSQQKTDLKVSTIAWCFFLNGLFTLWWCCHIGKPHFLWF
jgi:hypothetical protein